MSAPGVVLVHGRDAAPPTVAEYADELTMAGFAVETVDVGTGAAAGGPAPEGDRADVPDVPDGTHAAATVAAAVDRLRSGGAPAVGAVGLSAGADVVLGVALEGRVDAVVAYDPDTATGASAGTAWTTRPARTACPVQLHVGTGGAPDVPDDVAAFVAALEAVGAPVDHFAYPGAARRAADADARAGHAAAGEVARARTIGFLHARLAR